MSLFLTFTPSSKRNRFSSRIFREKGNRSTPWDFRAARLRISYFCLPTSSVVFALKLSVMFPPAKKKNYKRRRARRDGGGSGKVDHFADSASSPRTREGRRRRAARRASAYPRPRTNRT